jgi:hypothetical protein
VIRPTGRHRTGWDRDPEPGPVGQALAGEVSRLIGDCQADQFILPDLASAFPDRIWAAVTGGKAAELAQPAMRQPTSGQ